MNVKIKDVKFSYGSSDILNNITFELASKEVIGIIGANGTGKSTLIKCIDGLLNPQNGCIYLGKEDLKKMSRRDIAKHLGYVPQSSENLFDIKVLDMVLLGRNPHKKTSTKKQDKEKALKALKFLGMENLAMKNFNNMSGGQQQKIIIARAVAQEAKVLLLDEPTSSLDIKHQLEVMELIHFLVKHNENSAIISIHDLNLASRYCDKLIMMSHGKIIAAGRPDTVLTEKNIEKGYNVKSLVKTECKRPYVIPLQSL